MPGSPAYEAEGRDAVAAIRKALCSLGLAPGTPPPADSSDHKSMLVAAAAAVSSEATKVRRGSPLHARRRSHSHRCLPVQGRREWGIHPRAVVVVSSEANDTER